MNKRQLLAMWAGIAVMVLMGLFPPYRLSWYFKGYHAIWGPPNAGVIDILRLTVQWAVVAGVTAGAIMSLRSRKG